MSDPQFARELVPGTIIGVRQWYYKVPERVLRSLNSFYSWQPGVNIAACGGAENSPACRQSSMLNCTCGFYAYHQGGADQFQPPQYDPCTCAACQEHPSVTGIIEGFGRVVVGDRGFRAEKARVLCFFDRVGKFTIKGFEDIPVLDHAQAYARWPLSSYGEAKPALCMHGQMGPHRWVRAPLSSHATFADAVKIELTVEQCPGPVR